MRSRRPKYTYERRGPLWIVYRNEYTQSTCEGTPIAECHSPEEAREKVYQLNGWKKDGKKSKYKWYAIWTVYCILVIPFGIIIMISHYIRLPFELLLEWIENVKWWLVKRYKPE